MRKHSLCPAAILLVLIAAAVFATTAPSIAAQPAAAKNAVDSKVQCDRACLEGVMNRYLDAMVAHNPSQAPLAPDVQYAQDNVRLKIGQALWATATARGKYIHYFADPEQGDVGVITVVYENGIGAILIVRLKVEGGMITQAEQFVAHDPYGAANYEKLGKPDPGMARADSPGPARDARGARSGGVHVLRGPATQ